MTPKPLIPLLRKPVRESIIEHLARHDFKESYINTSSLSGQTEPYYRDGERLVVEIAPSYEGELAQGVFVAKTLGSAGGMRRIQDFSGFFDDTFAVLCGDALVEVALEQVVQVDRARGALATIVTKTVLQDEVDEYGVVVTDQDGRVQRPKEKPTTEEAGSTEINSAVYIFEPETFQYIPPHHAYDIGGQLFPDLIRQQARMYAVSLPFQWVDIGSVADFRNATRLALTGQVQGYRLPGREIASDIRVGLGVKADWDRIHVKGPVYIGSGSTIGDAAVIDGPTLIGANCIIEAGTVVRASILDDYTRVSSAENVSERIVFAGKLIDQYGASIDINEADIVWLLDDARGNVATHPVHEALKEAAAPG